MTEQVQELVERIEAICERHYRRSAGFRDSEAVVNPLVEEIRRELKRSTRGG